MVGDVIEIEGITRIIREIRVKNLGSYLKGV